MLDFGGVPSILLRLFEFSALFSLREAVYADFGSGERRGLFCERWEVCVTCNVMIHGP